MDNSVYKVQLLNEGMSQSDWLAIISLIISLISLGLVIFDRLKKNKLEKMNLAVSIKNHVWNNEDERLFLYCIFINESSLPITINSLQISLEKENIPNSDGGVGGFSVSISEPVSGFRFIFGDSTDSIVEYAGETLSLPITIEPFSSKGGYIGIYAGRSSSQVIPHKGEVKFKIETSKNPLIFEHRLLLHEAEHYYYQGENEVNGYKKY